MSETTGGTAAGRGGLVGLAGAEVYRSPDPRAIKVGRPGLCALPSGKLVAAVELSGPGVKELPGPKGRWPQNQHLVQTHLFVSGDRGQSWTLKHELPFGDPCLFRDGAMLYVLGRCEGLPIARSADGGETWSAPDDLLPRNGKEVVTESPASVWVAPTRLYMAVMMALEDPRGRGTAHQGVVVMSALRGANLLARKAWTRCNEALAACDYLKTAPLTGCGFPFHQVEDPWRGRDLGGGRWVYRMGWGAPHLAHLTDPAHLWHDPTGRTLHMLARADGHRANLALLTAWREADNGAMQPEAPRAPSGEPFVTAGLPGGHLRFGFLYDETSRLFWSVGNLTLDSLSRPESLPPERPGPADEECRALQLSCSRNLVDWISLGIVTRGASPADLRHAPALSVRAGDLYVIYNAGEARARGQPGAPAAGFACVPEFRQLARDVLGHEP